MRKIFKIFIKLTDLLGKINTVIVSREALVVIFC